MGEEADTTEPAAPQAAAQSGNQAAASTAHAAGAIAQIPLFDVRYRWVLHFALKWLREVPDIEIDLDNTAHLKTAYNCLSAFVQQYAVERGIADKLEPMRVAAIAESAPARATVEDILRRDHSLSLDQTARAMIERAVNMPDPSLEPAAIDRRARDRRLDFARAFGLHATIQDVDMSTPNALRMHVAFDEDIPFEQHQIETLVINGVALVGAQIVHIERNETGRPRMLATISANVDKGAVPKLKEMPMRVTVRTRDKVQVQAVKMA